MFSLSISYYLFFYCTISIAALLSSFLFGHIFSSFFNIVHVSVETLVISQYGASGDYPACTDLAYMQAVRDGADVIDCPVQMSKDGIPFCLSSIDLIESTTVAQSSFSTLATTIPQIKSGSGIFSFSLTSSNIKSLTRKSKSPE